MPTLGQLDVGTDPTVTYAQSNNPLVEPIGGLVSINDIMARFPEEVYHTGPDTRLYKFVAALIGDAGAGILKKQALVIRLKNEGPLLIFHDLDTFYAHILTFPRIRRELYNYDAAANTLLDVTYDPANIAVEKQVWDKIHAADASYQKRVIDFMHATRLGNSLEGMTLAAKAGSGEECEVVENYRYIFDQHSDDTLGLEKLGDTNGTGEFVIQTTGIGNTHNDANTVTLNLNGLPTGGTLSLRYDSLTTSLITFTVSDISTAIYNALIALSSGTLIGINDVTVTVVQGSAFRSYTIEFLDPQLDALFLGVATAALTGGTSPTATLDYPVGFDYYVTQFQYPLASFYEDNIATIITNALTIAHPITDATYWNAHNIAYGPTVRLYPQVEYNMTRIVDRLRPVGTVMTVKPKRAAHITVPSRSVYASSENFSVIRWITGNPSVRWPDRDATTGSFIQGIAQGNGISANVENEATSFAFGTHVFPAIFQTIDTLAAYTDEALNDATYNTPSFFVDRYVLYKSEHTGKFDKWISLIFPTLQLVSDTDSFFVALAAPIEPQNLEIQYPYIL